MKTRILVLAAMFTLAVGADATIHASTGPAISGPSCGVRASTTRDNSLKLAHCICRKTVVVRGEPHCVWWDCRNHSHPGEPAGTRG